MRRAETVRRGRLRQRAGLSARQSGCVASEATVAGRACTRAAIVVVTCASGCHSSSSVQWASQKTPSSTSTRAAPPERVSFVGPFMRLLFPTMRMSKHATFRGCLLIGSRGRPLSRHGAAENPHAHPQDCLSAEQRFGIMPGKGGSSRRDFCRRRALPPGSGRIAFSCQAVGSRGYAGRKMAHLPSPEPVSPPRGGGRRDRRD